MSLREDFLESIIYDANKLITLCDRDMLRSNITKQQFAGVQKSGLARLGNTKNELVKSYREFVKMIEPEYDPQLTDLVNKAKKKYEIFEEKVYQTTQTLEADWRAGNPGLNKPMEPPTFTGDYSEDHVLTFLRKFERRFRDHMTTQGMADYMYQNCLSNGVRREMSDVREDYDRLKKRLLEAYGDPTRIIAT